MKGKTIGYIKGVQNVGDCTAVVDLKVGMGVVLDRAAQTANLPASADEAKACYRIVSNINDKPEMHNFQETLTVKAGEKVRADDLRWSSLTMKSALTTTRLLLAIRWCLALTVCSRRAALMATRCTSRSRRRLRTWARASLSLSACSKKEEGIYNDHDL